MNTAPVRRGTVRLVRMRDLVQERIVAYRERNRILAAMGFSSYKAYLNSALWKTIRTKVLESNPFCFVCNANAFQVHHAKYRKKDLEGRDLSFLYPVCQRCHSDGEFDGDQKLSPKRATTKMRKMRRN